MAEIYALIDPRSGERRYIGKANSSQARLKSHIRDARRRDTPVYRWIRKLQTLGLAPSVAVLASGDDWKTLEREEIAGARASGARLLNVAEGGDEPFCSTEVRADNGRRNAEAIHSDPERKRIWHLKREMGSRLKRGELTETQKDKLRLAAHKCPELFGCWSAI